MPLPQVTLYYERLTFNSYNGMLPLHIYIVHFVNKILIRLLKKNLRKKTLNAIGSYLSIENVKIINNISKSLDLSCVYELRMISIQCHLAVKK